MATMLILTVTACLSATGPNTETTSKEEVNVSSEDMPGTEKSADPDTLIKVYYFHVSRRCKTCLTIEANAKEAVETRFHTEMASGLISWEEVNFDEEENAHFVKDFDLMFSSLIIAKYQDGKPVEWKNLQKVWELVRDKPSFLDYVQSEIQVFLEP